MIRIEAIDEQSFKVEVDGATTTTHTVTVTPEYGAKLTGGAATMETLVEKSFEFLLERESNTSILKSFDLTVISSYFPEYESTVQGML